ncbi:hypothetical protein [Paraburkholderia caribensis]|uniref:hypothetical protein n=1 Tax=Paraburkholderia caribensis TaxID=75105 RepID=UPI001CB35153|nr:hypothetical protein [Paraburkholderia caribensis]CAG9250728.1 hypothetical protein PCAR4_290016 [Paraburkholderia caribensis]
MSKDVWDIAVDIAQILSAIGTCGAVIVSLWLASQGRRPKARIVLETHKPFYQSAIASEARLLITNTGDRNAVIIDARLRLGRTGPSVPLTYGHYGDDNDKIPLTWNEVRPGVPNPFTIPYDHNVRNLRRISGESAAIPATKMRNLALEIEFSTGHVLREKVPWQVLAELSKYSELETRKT